MWFFSFYVRLQFILIPCLKVTESAAFECVHVQGLTVLRIILWWSQITIFFLGGCFALIVVVVFILKQFSQDNIEAFKQSLLDSITKAGEWDHSAHSSSGMAPTLMEIRLQLCKLLRRFFAREIYWNQFQAIVLFESRMSNPNIPQWLVFGVLVDDSWNVLLKSF